MWWLADDHGQYFFSQMQLVKPSGRLIKELSPGGNPYIIGYLRSVAISWQEKFNQGDS